MPEIDSKIIMEKYKALPSELKDAIFSEEIAEKIQEIGKKYALYIDKIGELGNESGRVMLGLTHPKDFIANLSKRLGVDAEKAKEIAKDVNEQIFAKVRESLKKLHKIGEEEEKISNEQTTKSPEEKLEVGNKELEIAPMEVEPIKPIEEKEILPEGIQRAPKQFREIKDEVEEAKKQAKYPGGIDPYKESIE